MPQHSHLKGSKLVLLLPCVNHKTYMFTLESKKSPRIDEKSTKVNDLAVTSLAHMAKRRLIGKPTL